MDLSQIFSGFGLVKPEVWMTLIALVALAFLLALGRKRWNARMLTYAAICIAMGFILSYIRFYRMPQGGSVTPGSMLPVMVFSFIFGGLPGILAGTAYGLLQLFQDFYVTHPMGLFLDYILAFACLGLAGFFRKNLALGVLAAGLGRFACHFLAGVFFFGAYAPEGANVALYSLGYNASVVGPDLAICLILVLLPPTRRLIERLRLQTNAGRRI